MEQQKRQQQSDEQEDSISGQILIISPEDQERQEQNLKDFLAWEEEWNAAQKKIQEMLTHAVSHLDAPQEQITVVIKGQQSSERNSKRNRVITIHLSGDEARAFQHHPTLDALWNAYGVWLGDGVIDDGKQSITIESIALA